LKGNFLLANLGMVTNSEFWTNNPNIGCVVNCIGLRHGHQRAIYPDEAAKSLKLYINTRNPAELPVHFARVAPTVEAHLEKGQDVVVHCRETFHRAPAVFAGLITRLCGIDYQVDR
jgi:hypothetical protein